MCPETFRSLAVESLQLAQKAGDLGRRSLLIEMAHSWADLANLAERFERLVETAALEHPPEHSATPAIKAREWRLPHSRRRPRAVVIVRSIKWGRAQRKVSRLTLRRQHDSALRRD